MRVLSLLLLIAGAAPVSADFFFGGPISTVHGGRLLEDLNGDGDLDAIEFTYIATTGWEVTWRPNDGNGLFTAASTTIGVIGEIYPPTGTVLEALGETEQVDLNGDGLLDIVRWEVNVPRIEVFFRDPTSATGYGPLTALMSNPTFDDSKPKYPQYIEFADLDGDGITDMVVGTGIKIWTMNGAGSGTFDPPVRVMSASHDGLLVDDSVTPAEIYFGTGNGFSGILGHVAAIDLMGIAMTGFEREPAYMELYDVDGDGDLDLIVGNVGGWYSGLAAGGWQNTKRSFMPSLPNGQVKLQLRDVDQDGDKDLFLTGQIDSSGMDSSLIREDGGTGWTTTISLDWNAGGPMGDLNGNGKMDILADNQRYPFDPDIFVGFVDFTFGAGPHSTLLENSGTQPLAIELDTPLDQDLTLTFAVAPDPAAGSPAVEGSHYSHGGDVVILAGATTADFMVTPVDNTVLDGDRHFTATITSTDDTRVTIMPASTTVTLQDDEYLSVTSNPAGTFVTEGSGVANVPWTVDTNLTTIPAFSLDIRTVVIGQPGPLGMVVPGAYDAWEGHDFTPRSVTLSIPAGTTSGNFAVTILDDTLSEFDESFGVEFIVNGNTFNSNGTGVFIQDDEPAPTGYMLAILTEGYGGPSVDPSADPDGDGLSNLLEYALGTLNSDPAGGERLVPEWGSAPGGSAFGLITCMRNPPPTDVVVTIEHSGDMGVSLPWTPIARREGTGAWVALVAGVTVSEFIMSPDTTCYFVTNPSWTADDAGFLQMAVSLIP